MNSWILNTRTELLCFSVCEHVCPKACMHACLHVCGRFKGDLKCHSAGTIHAFRDMVSNGLEGI